MIYFLTQVKEYMFFRPWNGIAQSNTLVFGSGFVGGQKFGNKVVRLFNIIETNVQVSQDRRNCLQQSEQCSFCFQGAGSKSSAA